jgi:hypothetical protein
VFVVGHRLDAATFAYRVAFPRALLDELVARSLVAKKHGRVAFRFGDVSGELRYSRVDRAWLVVGPRFRVRFVLHAPGAEGDTPGWTLEIVWSAAALAVMSPKRVRKASHRVARSCGTVYGARLRRIDLCADVAGWALEPNEVEQFVRRPQARLDAHAFSDQDVIRLQDSGELDESVPAERVVTHYKTAVTGFSFCPGAPMMARCYDKRAELKLKKGEIRASEEARWRERGWDGEAPVTRVEFQIRGEALRDFGLRDPDAPTQDARDPRTGKLVRLSRYPGFEWVLDRVWRACLSWLRLTRAPATPGARQERASRRPTDDRWLALAQLGFNVDAAPGVHQRVRRRGGATIEQTFGCVLSTLGQAGELTEWADAVPEGMTAVESVVEGVRDLFLRAADVVTRGFFRVWGTGNEAWEHVVVTNNAVWSREFDDGALDREDDPLDALARLSTDVHAANPGGMFAAAG